MAKKVSLDGMIDTDARPIDTGIPQRGAVPAPEVAPDQGANLTLDQETAPKPPPKRDGAKRLSLALDGETYRRLRLYAAMNDGTHQDILELALTQFLDRANA